MSWEQSEPIGLVDLWVRGPMNQRFSFSFVQRWLGSGFSSPENVPGAGENSSCVLVSKSQILNPQKRRVTCDPDAAPSSTFAAGCAATRHSRGAHGKL